MRFTEELHYVVTFFKTLCGNCRLYVSGRRLSVIGTRGQHIAMIRQVYRLTGRAFLLGVAGFCGCYRRRLVYRDIQATCVFPFETV
jgi:hypothetical protein